MATQCKTNVDCWNVGPRSIASSICYSMKANEHEDSNLDNSRNPVLDVGTTRSSKYGAVEIM